VGALAPERTVTVGSFSKSHAMTGYRVGYMHAPAPLVPQLLKLNQQSVTCLPAFVQQGALAGLEQAGDFSSRMASHYQGLCAVVREVLGDLDPGPMEGAFYAFVDIRKTGLDSMTFSDKLYDEHRVAVVPGNAFGAAGEGYVRISYAAAEETLRAGLGRFAAAVDAWSKVKS
jgi:aspartate/methionine/tyrosine aminotransferase